MHVIKEAHWNFCLLKQTEKEKMKEYNKNFKFEMITK